MRHARRTGCGFSYTEILVAIFLIALTLVPAIEALYGGVQAGAVQAEQVVLRYRLSGTMEDLLARPYSQLEAEADAAGGPGVIVNAYSDPGGTPLRRLVYLARYDGDDADSDGNPFTGVDEGLLWIRVEIEATPQAMESLLGR